MVTVICVFVEEGSRSNACSILIPKPRFPPVCTANAKVDLSGVYMLASRYMPALARLTCWSPAMKFVNSVADVSPFMGENSGGG